MADNQYQDLSDEEVQSRLACGQVNQTSYSTQKTNIEIIKAQVFLYLMP